MIKEASADTPTPESLPELENPVVPEETTLEEKPPSWKASDSSDINDKMSSDDNEKEMTLEK